MSLGERALQVDREMVARSLTGPWRDAAEDARCGPVRSVGEGASNLVTGLAFQIRKRV